MWVIWRWHFSFWIISESIYQPDVKGTVLLLFRVSHTSASDCKQYEFVSHYVLFHVITTSQSSLSRWSSLTHCGFFTNEGNIESVRRMGRSRNRGAGNRVWQLWQHHSRQPTSIVIDWCALTTVQRLWRHVLLCADGKWNIPADESWSHWSQWELCRWLQWGQHLTPMVPIHGKSSFPPPIHEAVAKGGPRGVL